MFTQISSIVENVCVFKEEASSTDPNCAVEKLSVSLQSCEPFCITDIDSSERLSAPDISRTDVIVGAFNSIRIAESSEKADRFDDASEIKRPGILCSSSRKRGTCMTKSNQKTETKKAARRCRKAANKKQWIDSIFSKVARRRRSCFCKRARSSGWGLLGNIAQVFQQNAGPDINQNVHKKLQKSRVGRGGRKQNKSQTGRSSQRSNGKDTVSTSRIRLKVKLGKEVGQSCLMDTVSVINNDLEKSWGTKREFPKLNRDIEGKLEEEVHRSTGFQCCHRNLNKTIMLSDASVLDVNVADKYAIKKLAGNCADNHHGIPSQEEVVGLGVTVDNRCLDAGTSPDSEVINFTPEAQISGEVPEDLHDVLIPSQDWVSHGDVTSLSLPDTGNKEGEKKNKHRLAGKGNCNVDGRLPSPEITNNVILFEKYGEGEKMGDDFYSSEASLLTMAGNASGNTCSCEGFSMEPLPSSRVTDFRVSTVTLKNESRAEVDLCSKTAVRLESPESQISEKLLPCSLPKGQKLPKSSGSRGVTKSRKEVPDSVSRRGNAWGRKGTKDMLVHKRKVKVDCDGGLVVGEVGCCPETGNHTLDDCGETKPGCRSTVEEISNLDMVPTVMRDQYVRPRNAWVCCDDCFKWRRIAAALADSIEETNSRWICRDNMDKNLADCSVPQEKSNAEINAELEISDGEEDTSDARLNPSSLPQNQLTVPKQSSWKLIRSNLFLHRTRKTQTIDEIMVCNCKAPLDGRMGCGDGCLNRMLNIECVKGTCPCGELCSNQQFQKRKYAKLKCFPSGKKGHGLHLVEDNIPKGRFLIEYVGEVLDIHAYGARQREYASKGHKHFYFMTLNGSEVIDACAKGNLGRFVNHSCEPNCRTEKWMVNGEVCIGLFAVRDIKKDEEVTFDYNYVRVFGAAAKKCVCGSSQCRGYIGGDPLNADIIVQGDSDEEYPEPVMVYEDCETNLDNTVSVTSSFSGTEIQTAENLFKNKDYMHKSGTAIGDLKNNKEMQSPEILLEYKDEIDNSTAAVGYIETTTENEDSMKRSSSVASKLEISSEMESSVGVLPFSAQGIENSLQPDDGNSEITSAAQQELSVAEETTKRNLCTVQRVENYLTMTLSKLLPETVDIKRKSKPGMEEDRCVVSKSHPRVKTSSSSVKKGKSKNNAVNVNKPAEMDNKSQRSKKLLEGSSNGHFEAVQEKLNELIDAAGGISKRKDASRGYLQLLFLTAASGDSGNGEAIQSNRDLSMILGALLKTKSRTVLVDIIDKNGLQMLHNIMKRYRREFNKIPILRKLLKVLEYLAVREILTLEHINRGPPCTGVESFRESILTLTDHNDKQVHQIARNFRDRWISRPFKNYNCMDREGGRMEFHRGANCNRFSASRNHASDRSGIATEAIECVKKSVIATTPVCSTSYSSSSVTNGTKTRKRKTRWDSDVPRYKEPKTEPSLLENRVDDGSAVMDEDVPPGFSPPLNGPFVPPNSSSSTIAFHQENGPTKSPCEVVMGQPQDRYVSGLPISYGIPLSVVHQFGTSQEEESVESWVVAPGMPFHSFPPLPPYPRGKKGTPPNSLTMNLTAAEKDEPAYRSDANTPSTSGASQPAVEIPCPHNFQRARGSSNSLGRRFFRQQKWNYSKFPPPWIRNRNGWGFMGNNSINGSYNTGVGSAESRPKGPYSSEEVSIGVQSYGNTFYQQPQHQNYH